MKVAREPFSWCSRGLMLCGYLLEQVAAFLYLSNRSSCSLLESCSNCLLVMPASFPAPLLQSYYSTLIKCIQCAYCTMIKCLFWCFLYLLSVPLCGILITMKGIPFWRWHDGRKQEQPGPHPGQQQVQCQSIRPHKPCNPQGAAGSYQSPRRCPWGERERLHHAGHKRNDGEGQPAVATAHHAADLAALVGAFLRKSPCFSRLLRVIVLQNAQRQPAAPRRGCNPISPRVIVSRNTWRHSAISQVLAVFPLSREKIFVVTA